MSRKIRIILFFVLFLVFIFLGPAIILYSQGYRFDFEQKRLTQTGGFFLKAIPKQVNIYLNEKFVKKTDFFFGTAFIDNLLPKKYKLRVEKEGFQAWEKTLQIKEKEVTEAKNVILFPKNLTFDLLIKNVEDFWVLPDEKKLIFLERNEISWQLKLCDLEKNLIIYLIGEKDIAKEAKFLNLNIQNSKEIYLQLEIKGKIKNFLLNLEKTPPSLTEKEITVLNEDFIVSKSFNKDQYIIDKEGYLLKNQEKLTDKPIEIKKDKTYDLEVFGDFIFLKEDSILYQYNFDSKSFEKIFEGLKGLKVSPDFEKLVYFSDFEIWILFLKNQSIAPYHLKREKIFLLRISEKIKDVFWLNSDYLIFNSQDKIKIIEIDDRDKINIFEIGEFENPKFFFNQNKKRIYILSGKNLYFSSPLF
jgi:hypothetical protein